MEIVKKAARKFRSSAFRRGVYEGFASHVVFFVPSQYRHSAFVNSSIGHAWRGVGNALLVAEESYGGHLGKIDRQRSGKSNTGA